MKNIIITIIALFIVTSFIVYAQDNYLCTKEVASIKEQKFDNDKWQRCVAFHGHSCPGVATGFRVAEAVVEKLHVTFSEDEELVCVTENDACAPDSIQALLGCTFGKGNFIFRNTGKRVFNFFNRKTGEKLRIYYKYKSKKMSGKMSKEEKQLQTEYILNAPLDELFDFSQPKFEVPEESCIFGNIDCELCGETAPEHKIRIQYGKKVCLDCFKGKW
ncbi:MAG: FmdE family protein [Planctomycetota bacterium]